MIVASLRSPASARPSSLAPRPCLVEGLPPGAYGPCSTCRGHSGWQATHTRKAAPERNGKALDQARQGKEPGPPCTPRARQQEPPRASVPHGPRMISVPAPLFHLPAPRSLPAPGSQSRDRARPARPGRVHGPGPHGTAGALAGRPAKAADGGGGRGSFSKRKLKSRCPKKVTGRRGLSTQKRPGGGSRPAAQPLPPLHRTGVRFQPQTGRRA